MNVAKKLLRAAIASAGAQTIAFRSSATSTGSTITAPSDIVAGDLLVLLDVALNTSGFPTAVTPFTSFLNNTNQTARRILFSKKIADGTEAGATLTGMNGTNSNSKTLYVFSTNGATSSSEFDIGYEATDNAPASQNITSASGSPPLVSMGFIRQATATGQSFSPTQDGSINLGAITTYYKIYNSSPSDITVSCGDGGANNILSSFYIEVN
jgi:hypothetical protein